MKKIYKIFLIIFIVIIIVASVVMLSKKNKTNKVEEKSIETTEETKEKVEEVQLIGENRLDEVDGYYYECVVQNDNYYKLKENATREEKEKIYKYHMDEKTMLYELCKNNIDLSLIPCDKDYESLGYGSGKIKNFDYDYDSIERIDNEKDNNGNSYILVKTKKDNNEKTYRIIYGWSDGSFNNIYVNLEEEKDISSNKILKDNLLIFDEEHIKTNFEELCLDGDKRIVYPQEDWDGTYHGDNIAVSDNFRNKYPYFLDLFIHYSPLEYNEITLKDLDIEKQIATFEVNSLLECKKRIYEVEYKLTDNLYLDDAEVNKINEIETEETNDNRTAKILYQHSNWGGLDLTEKFLNTHSNNNSIIPLFDEIDVDIQLQEIYLFKNNYYKYIHKYKLKNKNDLLYYVNFVCDLKGKIDEVQFYELPYTNISIEEAKEKFLADTELQKELGIEFD